MKKLTATATPKHLQIALISTLAVLLIWSMVDTAHHMWAQYPSNPNMSGYIMLIVGSFLHPLAITLIAYLLISRKISVLQKLYESVIVSIIATSLYVLTSLIFTGVLSYFGWYDAVWNTWGPLWTALLQAVPSVVAVVIYLLVMRRHKRW